MSEVEPTPKERQRGPGFPTVDLEEAIRLVDVLYKADHGMPASMEAIAEHWGTTPKSSTFLQNLASLKRFGLLVEVEGTAQRQLKPTKLAADILLLEKTDARRAEAIKTAALLPKIHAELWQGHKNAGIPSESTLIHNLVSERAFRPDSAKELVKEYKKTISFANLQAGDKTTDTGVETTDSNGLPADQGVKSRDAANTPPKLQISMPGMRDFKIPLVDSPDAVLLVPTRLTQENFDLLKAMVNMYLDTAKKALVKDEVAE